MSDDKDDSSSEMPSNSEFDRRLGALEKWRDVIDLERGQIMGELGEIKGLMQGLGTQITDVGRRLTSIEDKIEERPSRTEFKEAERQIQSIRAKAGKVLLSELEVTGPGNMKFKLLGVSGVTIVLVFFLIVVIVALWLVRK